MRPRFDLVLNTFAGQIANKKEINIYGGDQWRPFVHVQDVCEVIVKIIKLTEKLLMAKYLILQFQLHFIRGKKISKIFPKVKINFLLSNLDKRNYRVSTKKAKTILRFKPKYNLEKGIKDLVKFTFGK